MYSGGTKSNTECALYFKPDFFSPWKTNGIVEPRGQFVLYQRRMLDFIPLESRGMVFTNSFHLRYTEWSRASVNNFFGKTTC